MALSQSPHARPVRRVSRGVMRFIAFSLVAVIAIVAPVSAQKPVPTAPSAPLPEGGNPKMKAHEYRIAVKGCIRGRRLHASALETSDSVFRTLRATDFALSGPKELLQQIQDQHDGHWDEVEGVVTVPPSTGSGSSTVTTKELGKTRVTAAGREEGKAYIQEPPRQLSLKVVALTHLTEECAGH
jgi:hypothetical protein